MEENKRKRPGDHVIKERPRTPASRPKSSRPRTGSAASREAARKERLSGREQPARGEESAEEEKPPRRERGSRQEKSVRSEHASEGEKPVRRDRSSGREKPVQKELPVRKAPAAEKQDAPGSAGPGAEKDRRRSLRKKKPHRVYNTNFAFAIVITLSVVAVIWLSLHIFLKVKQIQVVLPTDESGQVHSYYTEDELRDASGINVDDNLLSLSKPAAAARIHAALPYVSEVQIKKQLPSTVIISFTEFDVTYGIQDEQGGWWLMSREGRILEAATEETVRGHLIVTGMPIQVPQVGDAFKPAATVGADMSEIANKQTVVLQLIPALEQSPFVKQLDRVDVSTSYDLTLWWSGGRYEIKLGTTERLEYKLQYFQTILENGSIENKSGTIDLTFNEDDHAHFLPFS